MRIIKVHINQNKTITIELDKSTIELDKPSGVASLGLSEDISNKLEISILKALETELDNFTIKY